MRLVAHVTLGAVLAFVLVAAGCGGQIGPGGSGGSKGSSGSGGSAGSGGVGGSGGTAGTGGSGGTAGGPIDAGPPKGCPDTEPTTGDACYGSNLTCEYGDSANLDCNKVYSCLFSGGEVGVWFKGVVGSGGACPPSPPACPSSWAVLSSMKGMCSAEGETCGYAEGTCLCTSDPGGLPIGGGPVWECIPASKGCPSPRPKLGTPCSAPSSTLCDYGKCSGGVGEQCVDGYWAIAMLFGCPA